MVANNPLIRPDFLRVAFASVPPSDSHNITKTPREPVLAIPSKRASNVAILAWQISSSGAYPIGYLVIGDSMKHPKDDIEDDGVFVIFGFSFQTLQKTYIKTLL